MLLEVGKVLLASFISSALEVFTPMSTTQQLAFAALDRARAMGWEVWINPDQSDVLDMATVVARKPGQSRCRVARWTEGQLSFSIDEPSLRHATRRLEAVHAY